MDYSIRLSDFTQGGEDFYSIPIKFNLLFLKIDLKCRAIVQGSGGPWKISGKGRSPVGALWVARSMLPEIARPIISRRGRAGKFLTHNVSS